MMNKLLCLVLALVSLAAYSQKTYKFKEHHYPAKYVLKAAPSDTVRTHLQNIGAFKAADYYPATWIKKLTFINPNGKKQIIKEGDLKYVEFTDNRQTVHRLVDANEVLGKDLALVEELYRGPKIGCYSEAYFVNIYGNIGVTEYITEKGKETIDSGMFSGSRKKMKERLGAYPDLLEKLDNAKTKQDYIELFKAYEAK